MCVWGGPGKGKGKCHPTFFTQIFDEGSFKIGWYIWRGGGARASLRS